MIAELTAFVQVHALLLNIIFAAGEGTCLFSVPKLVIGVCPVMGVQLLSAILEAS